MPNRGVVLPRHKLRGVLGHSSEIHLVSFRSNNGRPDLPPTPSALAERNSQFDLRVYVPPPDSARFRAPYDRLILMMNGLGETSTLIYDELGLSLAERWGIVSVLIPLPLHFSRHYGFPAKKNDPYALDATPDQLKIQSRLMAQRILQATIASPHRIMGGYQQLLDEIDFLVKVQIADGKDPYWSKTLSPRPTVSLFGYSLGGFTLIALLAMDRLSDRRYHTAFLLESGVCLDQIDTSSLLVRGSSLAQLLWQHYYVDEVRPADDEPLFAPTESRKAKAFAKAISEQPPATASRRDYEPKSLKDYKPCWRVFERTPEESREVWDNVVITLYNTSKHMDDKTLVGIDVTALQHFRRIFLGEESLLYKRELAKHARRILIISGGADEIFPTHKLLALGPDTGLALLQIPGISHYLKIQTPAQWLAWRQPVVDVIAAFSDPGREFDTEPS